MRVLSLEDGAFVIKQVAPRRSENPSPSLCLVQKAFIWAIGGSLHKKMMGDRPKIVERYNLQENVWDLMPSLNYGGERSGSCEHGGYVYAFNRHRIERIRIAEVYSDA